MHSPIAGSPRHAAFPEEIAKGGQHGFSSQSGIANPEDVYRESDDRYFGLKNNIKVAKGHVCVRGTVEQKVQSF